MWSSNVPGRRTVRDSRARERARRLRSPIVASLLALLAFASPGGAQVPSDAARCDLMENDFVRSIATGEGERITYISGPVLFVCEDGTEIRADSVVERSATQLRELIGGVEIDAPESRLTADRVHRSTERGRTEAWGDVEIVDRSADTRMAGDTLLLLEAGALRERDLLRMTGGQPRAVLRLEGASTDDVPPAPERPPAEPGADPRRPAPTTTAPDTVFGDRLYMEGAGRFRAGGSVRVRRPDLEAFGDSLDYDRNRGRAVLEGGPGRPARVFSERFDLSARTLDLRIEEGELTEAVAREDAELTGDEVRLNAPLLRIYFAAGRMDRLVAVGDRAEEEADPPPADSAGAPPPERRRAEAIADEFLLRGDSIEARAEDGQLERVIAVGRARGESLGRDTLNTPETPEVIRRDWLEGDTIDAFFVTEPVAAPDTAAPEAGTEGDEGRSRLDRLIASGNARSLYRMTRRDGVGGEAAGPDTARVEEPDAGEETGGPADDGRPAIHYVVGERITIMLDEGEVDRMEVVGQTRGLYLDPTGRPVGSGSAPETASTSPPSGAPRP